MKTAATILQFGVIVGIVVFVAMHPGGLLHLLGSEEAVTVDTFLTKSPDGATTKIVARRLRGNVHLDAERLNDHAKTSLDMSEDEYQAFCKHVKPYVVPGTNQVTYE